jgi:hypothetical protein
MNDQLEVLGSLDQIDVPAGKDLVALIDDTARLAA